MTNQRQVLPVFDHTSEVHGDPLLNVDVGATHDLRDWLGDSQVHYVRHDWGGADLTLIQAAIRLLDWLDLEYVVLGQHLGM